MMHTQKRTMIKMMRKGLLVSLLSNTCKTLSMPDIVQKFSLNTEQARIFCTVRSHVERTLEFHQNTGLNPIKPEQLLMYIGAYA